MFVDLRAATTVTCGGKAGALGHLLRAGVPVPDGFVVRPGAEPPEAGLATRLAALGTDPADGSGADVAVAVRSSASTEDTADASAAGQHDSFLGVRGARAVAEAVRACRESLWSARAVAYRRAHGQAAEPGMSVLVQRLVDAEVAGVLFTGDTVRIEASWGLGESVVHGLVTPDAWTVAPTGITARATGDKRIRVDRSSTDRPPTDTAGTAGTAGTGTARTETPPGDRHRPCLTDAQVHRIAAVGRTVEAALGGPVDVEFALAAGRIWVLQARPVTMAPPPGKSATDATAATTTLAGTPGSPGAATGRARILRGPADFARAEPGDIIVCRSTDPAWTPLFAIAAGFVTETGGVLSHAAIVAREHRIPAVLGVAEATVRLRDGQPVTVIGDEGLVLTRLIAQ